MKRQSDDAFPHADKFDVHTGLTKREWFAGMICAAAHANPEGLSRVWKQATALAGEGATQEKKNQIQSTLVAGMAVMSADALIEQLANEELKKK